ncbi:bifunctional DNA primase/polymerase [Streptomyces sp. TRM70308]|uniref:bifunctional DNA primase/polymerase n=1 Tax=Streptomyces TaxID=1883 RepID=UPI002248C365|nr:bifunctional DNA primase/polymerase [Streptomyces sp. JHD 1]MCX2967878.1 bifunctional DNA primase/polymerase [Streptomyces sp. JHD 1]
MREILGRRSVTRWARRSAALTCATAWQWPVVPGAELREPRRAGRRRAPGRARRADPRADATCACPLPDCPVPGAHPLDPDLLAATTDARMVRWWWTQRPGASVILATGGRAPCALSLPAPAATLALADLDERGLRTGPVLTTPTRAILLVRPYDLAELGELLHARDYVPTSLRFHGQGGYVPLPPTQTPAGPVCWIRAPRGPEPYLPSAAELLDALIDAGSAAPDTGNRLAH